MPYCLKRTDLSWQARNEVTTNRAAEWMTGLSALNLVNVTTCQHYPSALEDLTVIEECLIAKSHPVGTILKLRPGAVPLPLTIMHYEVI